MNANYWNSDNGNPFLIDSATEPIVEQRQQEYNQSAYAIGAATAYVLCGIVSIAAVALALAILFIAVSGLINVLELMF